MTLYIVPKKRGFLNVFREPAGFKFSDTRCQIDVIATHGPYILAIECKSQDEKGPSREVKNWIDLLKGRQDIYLKAIREHPKFSSYHHILLVLALSKEIEVTNLQRKYAKEQGVAIWDDKYISYCNRQPLALKELTLHNILAECGAVISSQAVHHAVAFKTKITITGFAYNAYSFSASPAEIIKYCYVARREIGENGYYQRIIDSGRLNKVAAFIEKGGSFVNNIIIAYDPLMTKDPLRFTPIHTSLNSVANEDLLMKLEDPKYNLEIGILQFPLHYKSFWVIDGQHRLFGYSALATTSPTLDQKGFTVPVVMIETVPASEQMKLFVDINHKQKPISANLIWDIQGDIDPNSTDGAVSNMVKKLDESDALKNRFSIPSRHTGDINLSAFCRAITKTGLMKVNVKWVPDIRNPFYSPENPVETANSIYAALLDYFSSLKKTFGDNLYHKLVLRSTPIEIFVALFALLSIKIRESDSAEEKRKKFDKWTGYLYSHIDLTLTKEITKATGEALKDDATKHLLRIIAKESADSDFVNILRRQDTEVIELNEFEHKLREWVFAVFQQYSDTNATFDEWFSRQCPAGFDFRQYEQLKRIYIHRDKLIQKDAKISDFLSLGNITFLLTHKTVQDAFMRCREELGTLDSRRIINHLNFIIPERNIQAHGLATNYSPSEQKQVRDSMAAILESVSKFDSSILGSGQEDEELPVI